MRQLAGVMLVLALASPAEAGEKNPFAWKNTGAANTISNVLVGVNLTADTVHNLRSTHRKRALGCQGLRMGLGLGLTELVKRIVHRDRPDHSDHFSFYSGHTMSAAASSGWRFAVGVPVVIGTGYFRMAANKHYGTDVAVGATVGLLTYKACDGRTQ